MCGIVGILGVGPVAEQLVDSLKRLEYRGYDSAGVATLENGKIERRRAEGKLKNLEAKLAAAPLGGAIGVGHTRWATHGKPTETNAHPHGSPRLAVVHDGMISGRCARNSPPRAMPLRRRPIPKLRPSSSRTNLARANRRKRRLMLRFRARAGPSRWSICSRARGASPDRRPPGARRSRSAMAIGKCIWARTRSP